MPAVLLQAGAMQRQDFMPTTPLMHRVMPNANNFGANMEHNNKNYTRGTLRKKEEPQESHWLWEAVGAMLALAALSTLGAWISERLTS
jgi:hypothetical protein